ncbi:hypothetical protein GCM10022252_68360 [Streptosporangium oxazolinicum]|uniref:Uncharacterized protein n=1 Tax=Streptosporangium oxazolinicum TaxID=909287 RepID=A0ABP8BGI3_9ACTN
MIIRQILGAPLAGTLKYLNDEYSFIFEPLHLPELAHRSSGGVTSVTIDTLQIEVGVESKEALYVWGFHPKNRWINSDLPIPKRTPGAVIFDIKHDLKAGISIPISNAESWRTEYDSSNDWLRVSFGISADEHLIEIADGILLGEESGELTSVWLNPIFD